MVVISCTQCGAPMALSKRITFESGPARLVYECDSNRNHVSVVEVDTRPAAKPVASVKP